MQINFIMSYNEIYCSIKAMCFYLLVFDILLVKIIISLFSLKILCRCDSWNVWL